MNEVSSEQALDLDAEDFLDLVWGRRQGWVDLPAKVGSYWVPYHVKWPSDLAVTRRIDACLRDGENLYFSVVMFKERGRRIEKAMASRWLWADLDEVHPSGGGALGILPTVAWRSSAGRYQALWRLTRTVAPAATEKLNSALSYHLGADRGGWDLTQVLRVPGTRNFKYPDAPMVQLLWCNEEVAYEPRYIWSVIKDSSRPDSGVEEGGGGVVGQRAGRRPMSSRARTLLRAGAGEVVEGERSARLWEIECLLAERGWEEDEIYEAVWPCAWNKWRTDGVRTGGERLRREIRKAIRWVSLQRGRADDRQLSSEGTAEPGDGDGGNGDETDSIAVTTSPFIRYSSFMAMEMEAPRWMVEGIWTQGSHGIVGGEPKTSKSTLALALGLSVASGKPWLGCDQEGLGRVHTRGPVLMVQEENAQWVMQDRMRKIARSYGLISGREITVERIPRAQRGGSIAGTRVQVEFPTEIPFRLLNNYGFDLSNEEHRDLLEREVKETGAILLIIDPLYLVLGGVDYDRANQLQPYLKWLLNLRYKYECAIMLIHHFRKANQQGGQQGGFGGGGGGWGGGIVRPGQRILGSTTLHGWVESAMYLSRLDDGNGTIGTGGGENESGGKMRLRVEREFRNVGGGGALEIESTMGGPGSLEFEARVREWDIMGLISKIVSEEPDGSGGSGGGGGRGVNAKDIAEMLGMDRMEVVRRVRGAGGAGNGSGRRGGLSVEATKTGRGTSYRIVMASADGEADQEEGGEEE